MKISLNTLCSFGHSIGLLSILTKALGGAVSDPGYELSQSDIDKVAAYFDRARVFLERSTLEQLEPQSATAALTEEEKTARHAALLNEGQQDINRAAAQFVEMLKLLSRPLPTHW